MLSSVTFTVRHFRVGPEAETHGIRNIWNVLKTNLTDFHQFSNWRFLLVFTLLVY